MYDYMRALEDRFTPDTGNAERRQELEAHRQAVSVLLDKQGRKKLLRLVDAPTAVQEEMSLSGFIAGFRLAWGIAMELGADGKYSYEQEQEQINRLKN
ncbi:MAG: hypothetical protein K2M15_03785 [Oscillospiraceae bacterium]|nr:hypothetical protein [Oscillospiraceae bacterium]